MSPDPKHLLGGYATDTLTEDERRELLRAALDDQELFDSIVEEEGIRELLESPGARQEVLAALEKPTAWEGVRAWFARPATLGHLVTVAAALLVVLVGYQVFRGDAPDATRPAAIQPALVPVPPASLAHLFALPPQEVLPAGLEPESGRPDGPLRLEAGEPLRLRISLRAPARVLLIGEMPGGAAAQMYPAPASAPVLLNPPLPGGPAIRAVTVPVTGPPGEHRLRLVVAPVDLDLGTASTTDLDRAAPRLSLVDLTYEVIEP